MAVLNTTEGNARSKTGQMEGLSLLHVMTAYGRMKVLAVACELKLFSLLADKPLSVEGLSSRLGAKPVFLKALLDTCVSMSLLQCDQGRYSNQSIAESYLVEGRPLYSGELIHIFSMEVGQWEKLHDLVMHGKISGDNNDVDVGPFTRGMHALGLLGEAEALAASVAIEDRKEMVDVGCGSGIYSITLCQHNPQLCAILLDKQEVLNITADIVAQSGIGERISLSASDIFKASYGENRDVVLLSDVLYATESVCKKILSSAYQALNPGGLLIVRGYFSDPEESKPLFGTLFDLNRLLWDPQRRAITVSVLRSWVQEVGFNEIKTFSLTELSTGLLAIRK